MSSQDVTVWQPRASMTQIVVTLVALFGAQLPVVWFLTNDGSLWERVLPLAIYVLGLLLVCWWLLPILKKPGVFIRGDDSSSEAWSIDPPDTKDRSTSNS